MKNQQYTREFLESGDAARTSACATVAGESYRRNFSGGARLRGSTGLRATYAEATAMAGSNGVIFRWSAFTHRLPPRPEAEPGRRMHRTPAYSDLSPSPAASALRSAISSSDRFTPSGMYFRGRARARRSPCPLVSGLISGRGRYRLTCRPRAGRLVLCSSRESASRRG